MKAKISAAKFNRKSTGNLFHPEENEETNTTA